METSGLPPIREASPGEPPTVALPPMRRPGNRGTLGGPLEASLTEPTIACGMCIIDGLAEVFPPALPWSLICPLWYLAICALCRFGDVNLKWSVSFATGLGLVAGSYVVGLGFIGPLALLPFGVAAAGASVQFLRLGETVSGGTRLAGRAIVAVGVAALGVSGVFTTIAAARPVTVESVLQCQGDQRERINQIRKLLDAEPASLPMYRELVRRAENTVLRRQALNRVEALGKPEEEVPWLLDLLEGLRRDGRQEVFARFVEETILRMTGCKPDPDSGIKGLREAWARKTGGR